MKACSFVTGLRGVDPGYSSNETVRILLDNGADPNVKANNGETALMKVCSNEKARILLDNGADPNIQRRERGSKKER